MFGFLRNLLSRKGASGDPWVALLTDRGSFRELFAGFRSANPLDFPGYDAKIAAGYEKSPAEAVLTGEASLEGIPFGLGVMQTDFVMGSLGSVAGEKIALLAEHCESRRLPLVMVCRSGGARMQEGLYSLMQMAKTSAAIRRLHKAGLFHLSILARPTTGGVAASFALQGDVVLAEPDALVAFAGPRVIEQVMKQKLPDGFQSAEFALEHGFVDAVVPRDGMRATCASLLKLHAEAP